MNPANARYESGLYSGFRRDGQWKARQLLCLLQAIPDKDTIQRMADVGTGPGDVLVHLRRFMVQAGFPLKEVFGYDIAPFPEGLAVANPQITFKHEDFLEAQEQFDLITVNDVLEHVTEPREFLKRVAARSRYVAIHIPLDDRLSVLVANQFNYRLGPVGHISFWNPASALNLVSAAGVLPLHCRFTPGFAAPSGRQRWTQRLVLPIRLVSWLLSPGLTAITLGGVSLAVLGRSGGGNG
jgi:SAM-dependent methyltransferase